MGAFSARLSNLRAFELGEERELAGVVAGLLWLSAALTVLVLVHLPGVPNEHPEVVSAVAAVAFVWGLACLTVVPWARVHPVVSHLSTIGGYPGTAIGVAATGGADSPAHLYLLFTIGFCAYFYPRREAVPHFILCIAVAALPLAYDPHAFESGLIAELLILAPTYLILGGFINVGKSRLVELREQARDLALRDPLTGLWNRRALIETLERSVERGGETTALLLVDLDYFKDVNTIYGHPVGDRVLCVTGDALSAAARGGDMVARLGGDEFAIVMSGVDQREALATSHRVLHEVREAGLGLELPRLRVTASVGFAIAPETGGDVLGLMAAADLALRGSKGSGKDRVRSSLDGTAADAAPA